MPFYKRSAKIGISSAIHKNRWMMKIALKLSDLYSLKYSIILSVEIWWDAGSMEHWASAETFICLVKYMLQWKAGQSGNSSAEVGHQ